MSFYTVFMYFLFLIVAFICLFGTSYMATTQLSAVLMHVTRSTKVTIYFLAFLFFPGVLIHELGHFLLANLLFVKTGEIEFFPKVLDDSIKLGSVAIAHTDPIRRFLIGVAPLLSGIGILLLAAHYLSPLWPFTWRTVIFAYILFEIGNTMFSSKKDMEGALGLFVISAVVAVGLFLLGAHIPPAMSQWVFTLAAQPIFLQISIWLVLAALLNGIVWIVLKLLLRKLI